MAELVWFSRVFLQLHFGQPREILFCHSVVAETAKRSARCCVGQDAVSPLSHLANQHCISASDSYSQAREQPVSVI